MADVETGVGPFVSTYLSSARHFNSAQIGMVMAAQNISTVLSQTPVGGIIDSSKHKKWLIAGAALVISVSCLLVVHAPTVTFQMLNQVATGIAVAFLAPTIAALSLGLVGRHDLGCRIGRNETFSHTGNVLSALLAGYLAYAVGQQWIFYVCALLGLACVVSGSAIRNSEINNEAARSLPQNEGEKEGPKAFARLLEDKRIPLFILIVVLFHTANSAMLPLAGQEISKRVGEKASTYMSACIVVGQVVMVAVAYLSGRFADKVGRKPIYLTAFGFLVLRGVLFTLFAEPMGIVAIEALDGVGTAIAGVLRVLVIADLAKGTGRFGVMQSATQASVGLGAFMGNSAGGFVAKSMGFSAAFGGLTLVAATGMLLYIFAMPETVERHG